MQIGSWTSHFCYSKSQDAAELCILWRARFFTPLPKILCRQSAIQKEGSAPLSHWQGSVTAAASASCAVLIQNFMTFVCPLFMSLLWLRQLVRPVCHAENKTRRRVHMAFTFPGCCNFSISFWYKWGVPKLGFSGTWRARGCSMIPDPLA